MTQNEWKELLVKMVKASGQEVIDRAEDLVGECDLLNDIDITLRFPVRNGHIDDTPTIEVTRSHASKKTIDVLVEHYM